MGHKSMCSLWNQKIFVGKWPHIWASPWLSSKNNLSAMQESQELCVSYLGREDPLEKEMATHSSILAWRIPWTEEPGGLQSRGRKESDTTGVT